MSISITDAFQADQINLADVILDDEQETELRQWLEAVVNDGGGVSEEDAINLAGLAFVAGRCFQTQFNVSARVPVEMDVRTLSAFLAFMAQFVEE